MEGNAATSDKAVPKGDNELVGPQQAKEVVDEEVLQLLVPHSGVVAGGVVGTVRICQGGSPCRGWGWRWGGWGQRGCTAWCCSIIQSL